MDIVKKKIARVNKALIKFYGVPLRPEHPPDPVDMLIGTILSQNTNDKNSYKAFINLKTAYKSWEEVAKQPRSRIETLIKTAGLGKQKSTAIKDLLTSLLKSYNKITLEYLTNLKNKDILDELTRYQGVGVKTASCVLLFALRRNVCPVDTHVHRTTNRIGIVETSTPDKTSLMLNGSMAEGIAHQFHTNLIRLGREICKPSNPGCFGCPLVRICEFSEKNMNRNTRYKVNDFLLLDSIK
jgi:endonuclease-3